MKRSDFALEDILPVTKACFACKEVKFITEFNIRKVSFDGFSQYCRPCKSGKDKVWRNTHKDEKRAYDSAYRSANKEKSRLSNQRYYRNNKVKVLTANALYYNANVERIKERTRDWDLQRKFNISLEEFQAMVAAVGGKCEMCGNPPNGRGSLHVDHDHLTGKVRGLLCFTCNTFLGRYEGSLGAAALDYLRRRYG